MTTPLARLAAGKWQVLRHGGRRNDAWRVIGVRDFEDEAREVYALAECALRQGGVQLVSPDGRVIASISAPRLRSRW